MKHFSTLLLLLLLPALLWVGCDTGRELPNQPAEQQAPAPALTPENPQVRAVMSIQDAHTPDLMSAPGVVGTATGLTEDGQVAVLVYLRDEAAANVKGRGVAAAGIPATIEGVPVVRVVTGELRAFKSTTTVSHTAKQTPPVQLGTSGGWRYDLANGYCCGGTLGALIQKGGTQYVLSNYHVLWSDIVSGGNGRVATAGDPVIQPALIDVGCNAAGAQDIATLAGSGSLPSANVDAGYAQVISGMVRTDGASLEVGTISATTIAASIGQAVKKSGRTTGLTRSTVSGLNGTVSITYENECAGGTSFTKTFTGQIIIANARCKFQKGGDSGSLLVQDVTTNPKAVGLCFAGSSVCTNSSIAIANPIGEVLAWAGATMVGL
jgi:hypothetical protein